MLVNVALRLEDDNNDEPFTVALTLDLWILTVLRQVWRRLRALVDPERRDFVEYGYPQLCIDIWFSWFSHIRRDLVHMGPRPWTAEVTLLPDELVRTGERQGKLYVSDCGVTFESSPVDPLDDVYEGVLSWESFDMLVALLAAHDRPGAEEVLGIIKECV